MKDTLTKLANLQLLFIGSIHLHSTNYRSFINFLAEEYISRSLTGVCHFPQLVTDILTVMEVPGTSASAGDVGTLESDIISCPNCFIYGEFCVTYSAKFELLVSFAQRHGLILNEKHCPHCDRLCRVERTQIPSKGCGGTLNISCLNTDVGNTSL